MLCIGRCDVYGGVLDCVFDCGGGGEEGALVLECMGAGVGEGKLETL